MKKLSAISCSFLLAGSAAIAADVSTVKAPGARTVQAAPTWTGFYAGLNAAYGTGSVNAELFELDTSVGSQTRKFSGAFAGGQVGFNQQIGNFVWGAEGDIQKSWQKGSRISVLQGATVNLELEVPWLATARLRAGIANGPSLFYLTGGGVWTEGKSAITIIGVGSASASEKRNGWTIGAGYEAILSQQWSWKLEYLYAKIREKETDFGGVSVVDRVHDHIVRVGVNYRFGG
jgi:outer membrane immunogenic protein